MNIKDVMTLNPVCCPPGATLKNVAEVMREDIGGVPIVDGNGALCGIVATAGLQATGARSPKQQAGDRASTPH